MPLESYDALLLVSFGGPEGPDDVLPFLENVTRGRGIPRERLLEVGEHYQHFGGVSPINAQCRDLLAALRADLAANGVDVPVYWGNRNWAPMLADTIRVMREDGVTRALAIVTSAYSSYSGCRQYRENLWDAVEAVGDGAPRIDKVRHYFNHPGFVEPTVDAVLTAAAGLPEPARDRAPLVFTTHSVPQVSADTSGPDGGGYVGQHLEVARLVAEGVAQREGAPVRDWQLVYQSRSGPPAQPWLEPDVNDHLEALHAAGAPGAVLVPIGFVSDHMEVLFDLDVEARETAARLGLPLVRAATVGTDPRFVAALRELVLERDAVEAGANPPRAVLGRLPASHDVCPVGCCPNPRGARPALCGRDTP